MPKYELTIDVHYQGREWGLWEACRDLIANALDAEIEHKGTTKGRAEIDYDPQTKHLYICNHGIRLSPEVLLMGRSTKMDRTDTIGKFGEGLNLSLLVLARLAQSGGYEVTIENDDEDWVPAIERSATYKADVLVVNTRKLKKPRGYYAIHIFGVEPADWAEYSNRFLRLSKVYDEKKTIKPNSYDYNRVLLQSEFKGKIFVKGVMVMKRDDVGFGYDLDIPLNRDRHLIGEWDLRYKIAGLVGDAMKADAAFIERLIGNLDSEDSNIETLGVQENVSYNSAMATKLLDAFFAKHGEDTIPAASLREAEELRASGLKAIVVPVHYKKAWERIKGSIADAMKRAVMSVDKVFNSEELTPDEISNLSKAINLCNKSSLMVKFNFDVGRTVRVVEFRSHEILGRFSSADRQIDLAKKSLVSLDLALKALVHEAAHAVALDHGSQHNEAMENAYAEIILSLL